MWLWSEQTDEMFTQKSGQIKCAEAPALFLKSGLL